MPELAGQPTPETPVAAPEATQQPDTTADQVAQEQPESQPEKTLTQSEVNKLIAREKAKEARRVERAVRAEAERDFYRQQLEAQKPQARPDGRPREEDFAGKPYTEYIEALAEWRADQRFEQKLKAREQETQTQRQQREAAEQAHAVKERLSEGADEFPDFEEVALADHVPISQAMAAAIAESDFPAKVAYYLGSHLEEAKRIYSLPPTKQIREIAKIEATLSEPAPTTKAPPPIKPASGKASAEKDPDKMTTEEWKEWREADLRSKRRR
jgi:hypothetical protein